MPKLNQIIAVAQGKKTACEKALTSVYQTLAKSELFNGLSRQYQPLDEEGETLPPEKKLPQMKVTESINLAQDSLRELIDVVATMDYANTTAKSDIVVDGKVVVADVPVTHLLFLEKQLTDLQTFVTKLPTLDPTESWDYSPEYDMYVTDPIKTNRTAKKMRNHVVAEATDKHPAQVQVYTEDVKVGEWTTTKFSGALSAKEKNVYLTNVKKLIEAVKFARESANSTEVQNVKNADAILNFVFS